MPISAMIRLGTAPKPTNQQLVDMALIEDQERRRQLNGGDLVKAAQADAESAALCELLA